MFIGEHRHNLDSKSRLIVPAKFRNELGDTFVMTRGLEGCLFLFPQTQWKLIADKLNALPLMKKDARQFARFFLSGATEVEPDKNGRFVIPQSLLAYGKLQKECVIIGVSNRVEIWDREAWDTFTTDSFEHFEEVAESLIDFEIQL